MGSAGQSSELFNPWFRAGKARTRCKGGFKAGWGDDVMASGSIFSSILRIAGVALIGFGLWVSEVGAAVLAPQDLTAIPSYGGRVDLRWQSAASAAGGYRVARECEKGDEEGYCPLAELGPGARDYRDLDVTGGRTYAYRVEAIRASESAAAYVSATTPPSTRLPQDRSKKTEDPLYFEPQGAWSLGAASSLARIRTVRIGHNLARKEDLGVLLKPRGPVDPKAPCRAHSLPALLEVADFKTARLSSPSRKPEPKTAEVYFVDLSRDTDEEAWVRNLIPEFELMGEEGYALRAEFMGADSLRILVGARTPQGLFRGGMTVQRLLVDDTLCSKRKVLEPVVVLDYPDHRFRAANPRWKYMSSNRGEMPEASLDMLDSLARSGANEVGWGSSWAAQDAYSWDRTGARAAAAVQQAAAERFMTVKFSMGFSGIGFGKTDKGGGIPGDQTRMSFSQAVYGDGLAVVDEPFSWFETKPGHFEALAQRAGRLLDRDADMGVAPFRPSACGWTQSSSKKAGAKPAAQTNWFLEGPVRKCRLSRPVMGGRKGKTTGPGSGLEKVWIKPSPDAVEAFVKLGFEVIHQDGTRSWVPVAPTPSVSLRNGRWVEYELAIPESIRPASRAGVDSVELVVEASVADGGRWVRQASPWVAAKCGESTSWEFERGGAGSPSAWRLVGPSSECALSQALDTVPPSSPGGYFLSAWVDLSADAVGVDGSVSLEVTGDRGTRIWPVRIAEDRAGEGWSQITRVIPASAVTKGMESARLIVKASLREGSVAVDRIRLHARSVVPFQLGKAPHKAGWTLSSSSFSSGRGGLGWDRGHGRTDSSSFGVKNPMSGGRAESVQFARFRQDILLEEGLYLLGAWLQVDSGQAGVRAPFPLNADIQVELLEGNQGSSGNQVLAAYLNFPKKVSQEAGRWVYYINVFRLNEEEARRVRSMRLRVRAFGSATEGQYWIDDIDLLRLDGDLRNLLGAVQPPILKRPSGEAYVEGRDYEVCQVGTGVSQCVTPENFTEILRGGLTSSYEATRPPFEIRWLRDDAPSEEEVRISYDVGAQYRSVAYPLMAWDGQIYTPGALNFCDFEKVATGIQLDEIFGRFLDGYTVKDFPRKGEDHVFKAEAVTWSVSEVRGMNRSVACRRPDGEWRHSNAALFAQVVNRAFLLAKKKSPKTRFVLWADMFDPFYNGGDLDYQVRYGGVPGRSACSFAPARIASMCGDEVEQVSDPIL
ncbi:MAG: hypothetical protein VX252_16475, partial [Myxococcota bacterium]|nr:hypothetical protein [Myxococcota bacterium]